MLKWQSSLMLAYAVVVLQLCAVGVRSETSYFSLFFCGPSAGSMSSRASEWFKTEANRNLAAAQGPFSVVFQTPLDSSGQASHKCGVMRFDFAGATYRYEYKDASDAAQVITGALTYNSAGYITLTGLPHGVFGSYSESTNLYVTYAEEELLILEHCYAGFFWAFDTEYVLTANRITAHNTCNCPTPTTSTA